MTEKTKVCYVINRLSVAGPVSVVWNIVSNIDLNRFDVSVVTISPEKKDSQLRKFLKLKIQVYSIPHGEQISVIEQYQRLSKLLKKIAPDIVHAHCTRSLVFCTFLRNRYKLLFTYHNYPGPVEKVLYGKVLGPIISYTNMIFSKFADCSVACSESIANDLWDYKKIHIGFVNNGVNCPVWQYSDVEKSEKKSLLGLRSDISYFISIGRLSPEKNMGFIVDAVNRINNPQIGLIILGDGEQNEFLKSINKNQNVIFPGHQTDVNSYIIASDYYVSASTGEGLSMALLECMSVGLPMLLSDISSHRMVLSKFDTNVGFVFEQNNIEDITTKMSQLLSLDTLQASEKIKDVYNRLFTARVMAENYEKEYEKLNMMNCN